MSTKRKISHRQYPAQLQPLIQLTGSGTDQDDWLLGAELSIEFLRQNPLSDDIVLFASLPHVLVHGVLVPLRNLKNRTAGDLMGDHLMPGSLWRIDYEWGGGGQHRVILAPPFGEHDGDLRGGERLVCHRSWAKSDYDSLEISQKFLHAHDLHYVEEHNAYCQLNKLGDIEEVVMVFDQVSEKVDQSVRVVTVKATQLYEYAFLSRMAIVYLFDFTRFRPKSFNGWGNEHRIQHRKADLAYDGGVQPGTGSYINGRQIVRPRITRREILKRYKAIYNPDQRDYATFKAKDLRSGRRIEVSCSPACLSNYFVPASDRPLEMSPVFFRSEVLRRFKADPDKYVLSQRSISCKGAWALKTYDVNEVGQVHTYLRYLQCLPYEEQLYWQSFNEWPKGPLSSRAITTDFHGDFSTEYDPVLEIKMKTRRLDETSPEWWIPRGKQLTQVLHHPVTGSKSEWADAIFALQQLIVEGFHHQALKRMVVHIGVTPEEEWRSLKLLEICLSGHGVAQQEVDRALGSLRDLQYLRSVAKGHGQPEKRTQVAKEAMREHGTLRAHFESLASDCDNALDLVITALHVS